VVRLLAARSQAGSELKPGMTTVTDWPGLIVTKMAITQVFMF
jgi:hypothetical protein